MEELQIQRLGHHGDGVAVDPTTGHPVFAAMTLPGEVVRGTIDGDRLRDVKIVTPSADRVAPPCRHFRSCGGCSVQHMSDEAVAAWKIGIVEGALKGQGITAEIAGIHTSPAQSRRRAALSGTRTKKGAMVGFHGRGSAAIVEIPDCRLLDPKLVAALPVVEDITRTGGARKGDLSLTVTLTEGGLDMSVTGGKPLDEELRIALTQAAQRTNLARLAWDGEVIVTLNAPEQIMGRAPVTPPPGAFLQATRDGEAVLLAEVLKIVKGAKRTADLFAGCGTFALPLSELMEVHAVEGDKAMTRTLEAGWRRAGGLRKLTAEARDLFRNPLDKEDLKGFDAVVIDPPRAGAEAQVAEIAAARVPRVAHVSCNPATFAREAKVLLAAGYEMSPILVVDQFRWSAHVELVAGFRLTSA